MVWATEAAVEDGGEGGFGITAVGAGVAAAVAQEEAEATDKVARAGGKEHEQGGEAGGNVVGHIVKAGGEAAKVLIAGGAVGYHGVEGIYHLVGEHAGSAEESEPKEGGNDAVAEVFGEGFEGSGADFLGGEGGGVATDDAGDLTTAGFKGVVEGKEDLADFADEGCAGEAVEDEDEVEEGLWGGWEEGAEEGHDGEGGDDEGKGDERAFQKAVGATVEAALAGGDSAAKPHDGVRQTGGVAQEEVEQPAEKQGEGVSHGGAR